MDDLYTRIMEYMRGEADYDPRALLREVASGMAGRVKPDSPREPVSTSPLRGLGLDEGLAAEAAMKDNKIDALAVMDSVRLAASDHYLWTDFDQSSFAKARTAVAELIEAAQAATAQVFHNGTSSREACERLDAAWRACIAANA